MTTPVLPAMAAWTAWRAKRSQSSAFLAVRRAAADLVTRVEVTHDDRDAFGFEERLELLAQKRADVLELNLPEASRAGVGGEQILARDRGEQLRPRPRQQ